MALYSYAMDLTEEQKQAVISWVQAGESLAEVQRRLESEYALKLTFMEVRFLVDDLDVTVVDKPEPVKADDVSKQPEPEAMGGVRVEVDKVQRPGAMLSGSVTFSDGNTMGWQLDQTGRLGLLPGPDKDYRPSESDVADFQQALQQELQKQGF